MDLTPAVKPPGLGEVVHRRGPLPATSPNRPLDLPTELAIQDTRGVERYYRRGLICVNT